MFVAKDKSKAIVTYVQKLHKPYWHRRIKLTGLDPDAVYHLTELHASTAGDFGGDELMYYGFMPKYEAADFVTVLKHFKKVPEGEN